MRFTNILLILVAVAAVALSAMNASWVAANPAGSLIIVAHRGIAQPADRAAGGCGARIRASDQLFIENTVFSMQNAVRFGADAVMIDVQASSDGHAMVFRDADLACRTNGAGRVGEHPLAFLKSLDIGYRYTADGRTFPLRGRGQGGMPTVEEVLRALPRSKLIFALADPRAAEALVAAFAAAGVAIDDNDGFAGDAATLARLRQLTHGGWILDPAASTACLDGYRRTGWLGIVPDSCRGVTLIVPRRGEWTLWGWPYRFMDRLQGVGARFFIAGEPAADGTVTGLDSADQLDEVPRHFAGMLLIEDMNEVGRALQR
jgi:glycerophosphoryl diester phosphodiesterase